MRQYAGLTPYVSPKNVRFFKANVRFIKQFTLVCAGVTLKNLGQ